MLALSTLLATSPSPAPGVEAPQLESQVVESSVSGYDDIDDVDSKDVEDSQRISQILDATSASSVAVSSVSRGAPEGIDIASHQHNASHIDIREAVTGSNLEYIFIKATEGTNYVNPYFHTDSVEAINSGVAVGFYHYAKPTSSTSDARKQARHFVSTTGIDQGVKSLPPVLDLEENKNNLSSQQLIDWTQAYVDEIKKLTGKTVMMYTYPSFWRDDMDNTTRFSDLPLWIAHYHSGSQPDIPGGWTDWTFWQHTSSGRVDGYDKNIDKNYFNGSSKALQSIYQ